MGVAHRFGRVIAVLAVSVLLAGCSYVDRVAARLNTDGTLDFATCEAGDPDSFEVEWILPESSTAVALPISSTPVVGDVEVGDYFRLESLAPRDEWEAVSVRSLGTSNGIEIDGRFSAEDLASGDWVWNQTGIFFGTVDVEHCDLAEADAR